MKKIVVGYDGTNVCKEALSVAKTHAAAFGAKVCVLTSLEGGVHERADEIETAEKGLEYAQSYLKSHNVDCETHLLIRGLRPGEDIVLFAEENKADEIIIGVRRRSKMGKLLFGSNAQFIILEAPCPVCTVK